MANNDQDNGLQLQVASMEQFKELTLLQNESNPTDLVVKMPDGFEVVFKNYIPLAQAGTPPAITLEDGTVIPGHEIVALIDNLNYDLIATAAGNEGAAPNGGGAGFSDDPSGMLGDELDHGPYRGGIEIGDGVGFSQLPGALFVDPELEQESSEPEEFMFEVVDDNVIAFSEYDGVPATLYTLDIPDIAFRHNDIYPRGDWDLSSVQNPGPNSPPQSNYESEWVTNLGSSEFYGSNTTARYGANQETIVGNNVGDTYASMDLATIADESGSDLTGVDRVYRDHWDHAEVTLMTINPNSTIFGDWDGFRIYLHEGETITITPGAEVYGRTLTNPGDYYIALDTGDGSAGGVGNPIPGTGSDLNWDYWAYGGSLTYTVEESGYHYIGTGFETVPDNGGRPLPPTRYYTTLEIDGVGYGEFEYTATDGVSSDSGNVTVDYRDRNDGPTDNDTLGGTAGDDIILSGSDGDYLNAVIDRAEFGSDGMDVLIGRGGDDHLWGGADSDLFLYESASSDGHDTIYDFNTAEGDIVNLDILFDALGVASSAREGDVLLQEISGDTVLTVQGVSPSTFSITFDSTTDLGTVESLINNGNLVVDVS